MSVVAATVNGSCLEAVVVDLLAHSVNGRGEGHALRDHLYATAAMARGFLEPAGLGELAWLVALLHDCGKASCRWQEKLLSVEKTGGRVGIDHKMLGCQLAIDRGLGPLATAIHGHHGGLVSWTEVRQRLKNLTADEKTDQANASARLKDSVPETVEAAKAVLPQWDQLGMEMAIRMLFSALVDADDLDTQAHFDGLAEPRLAAETDFSVLWKRFLDRRSEYLKRRRSSAMDKPRGAVFEACVEAGGLPPGVFRLPAPTGAAKTMGALGFALRHATEHRMRRVVVATPYITITRQNAQITRRLLDCDDDPVVLEHHSEADLSEQWRHAAENWDAPVVLTTQVRLFESLFGRSRTQMRRVHRLCNAVIVLDEVQALPRDLLLPLLDGVRRLVDDFGATVLLSSATPPQFWHLTPFKDLAATDITPDPQAMRAAEGRVRFEWWTQPRPALADVADYALSHDASLTIVNTTKDALRVYRQWQQVAADPSEIFHMSRKMAPVHLERVLDTVNARLGRGLPVFLVATPLIEAGVDMDFPVVLRAWCSVDSMGQAAGRTNRDARLAFGRLIVFDAIDGGQPPGTRTAADRTAHLFGPGKASPDDEAVLERYWRDLFRVTGVERREGRGARIQQARRKLDFLTVTHGPVRDVKDGVKGVGNRDSSLAFRMIDDDSFAMVTADAAATPEERHNVAENVAKARVGDRDALRALQPYIVNLHRFALRVPGTTALLTPIIGEPGAPGSLAEWTGSYDADTGISIDPHWENLVL